MSTEPVLSYSVASPPMRNGQQDQKFTVILKKASEINMEELVAYLSPLSGHPTRTQNFFSSSEIMFLDIVIRQVPSNMYTTVGRSIFIPNNAGHLSNGANI